MANEVQRWANPAILQALSGFPCTQCLSDKDLLLVGGMALCYILSTESGANCNIQNLVNAGACQSCFSERQLKELLVKSIIAYGVDNGLITDYATIVDQIRCMPCATKKTIEMGIIGVLRTAVTNGTLFNPA